MYEEQEIYRYVRKTEQQIQIRERERERGWFNLFMRNRERGEGMNFWFFFLGWDEFLVLTIKEPNIITEFFGFFFFFSVIVLASIKELKYFNGTNVLNFKDIVI